MCFYSQVTIQIVANSNILFFVGFCRRASHPHCYRHCQSTFKLSSLTGSSILFKKVTRRFSLSVCFNFLGERALFIIVRFHFDASEHQFNLIIVSAAFILSNRNMQVWINKSNHCFPIYIENIKDFFHLSLLFHI